MHACSIPYSGSIFVGVKLQQWCCLLHLRAPHCMLPGKPRLSFRFCGSNFVEASLPTKRIFVGKTLIRFCMYESKLEKCVPLNIIHLQQNLWYYNYTQHITHYRDPPPPPILLSESTAGADASVEIPKLHNIKLLYTWWTFVLHCSILLHANANSKSG